MVSAVFGRGISQYRVADQKVEDVELMKQELTQEVVRKGIPRTVREGLKEPWYSKPRKQPIQTRIAQKIPGDFFQENGTYKIHNKKRV